MRPGLTSTTLAAVKGEVVGRTTAVALEFPSSPVRVNASPVSITIEGEEFLGVGSLGSIGPVEEGADLSSYGLRLTLAGVPRDSVAASLTQQYQGRRATVWEVVLDPNTWQVLASPIVIFRGRMDQMDVQLGETATVQLRLENRMADWQRPRVRRYTDEDQRQAHPGDPSFRFVSATAEKEIVWPAASFKQ